MKPKASVVIVERLPLFAEALARLLSGLGADILGCTENLAEGLEYVKSLRPSLTVLDRDASDLDVVATAIAVRKASRRTRLVLLYTHFDALDIRLARRERVCAWLFKTESTAGLRHAFQQLLASPPVRSTRVRERARTAHRDRHAEAGLASALAELTPRELQVLPYIARGFTVRQISEITHVSPKTVDSHKTNLMAKLGIHDRVTLVRFAIREGLIPVWEE